MKHIYKNEAVKSFEKRYKEILELYNNGKLPQYEFYDYENDNEGYKGLILSQKPEAELRFYCGDDDDRVEFKFTDWNDKMVICCYYAIEEDKASKLREIFHEYWKED